MSDNKINLKLDESNNLQFALSIKGSTTEPGANSPTVRFSITEKKTGFACSFPVEKKSDGIVSVVVPEMSTVFKEGSGYEGKLEIFVGNRYFTPTVVDVSFDKTLKFEAVLIKTAEDIESSVEKEDLSLFEVDSVIKQPQKTMPVVKQQRKAVDQKILQKAMFSESKPKPAPAPSKQVVTSVTKKAPVISSNFANVVTEEVIDHDDPLVEYKNKIKSMIKSAVRNLNS
jgi:hypothetical protein